MRKEVALIEYRLRIVAKPGTEETNEVMDDALRFVRGGFEYAMGRYPDGRPRALLVELEHNFLPEGFTAELEVLEE